MRAFENECARVALSTAHGPFEVDAFVVGPLAVHPMLGDDLPLHCDPANGYCVSLVANGKRMSYGFRTFRGMAACVDFARRIVARADDWERWFTGPRDDLGAIFLQEQQASEARGELTDVLITPPGTPVVGVVIR